MASEPTTHMTPNTNDNPENTPDPSHDERMDEELRQEIEQFEALIDQHLPAQSEEAQRGEVIEVPIVAIREDSVLVDIGGKAEASIRLDEFPIVGDKRDVQLGQMIKVVQLGREGDGTPRLSHREARHREAEGTIRHCLDTNTPIRGRVTQMVKGGLMVDIGLSAFMPASQVDLFKIPDLSTFVGKEIDAYVQEYDARRKRAVLSRRKLLFEQRESERRQMLDSLTEGQVIKGTVKSALDFGVFVDLGVIDGFIPREEVSYDRGTHPNEITKAGEEIEVKIVKVDRDSGKITLSRKRMAPDPWDGIDKRYPIGSKVTGRIIAIQNYGAFVHIDEGVTGMIHASDISWAAGNKKPSDFVKVDDTVECLVLEINPENKRLSLGLKQVQMDPWADVEEKYPKGKKVRGTVTSMTNYGAFIKLDEYIEGMVHVSDLSWERRINHPKEVLKVGEEVDAVVLKVEGKGRRLSLGVKQVSASPFDSYIQENPVNSIVKGKVTRFAPFGAFVELAENLEGLIHISQIDEKRVELPEKALSVGEEVTCKIVKIDARQQKISLSRKEALKQVERDNVKAYMKKSNESVSGMTFGEALAKARKDPDQD
jgi:small subunit ribosomal protein S1